MNEQLGIMDIVDMMLRRWIIIVLAAVIAGVFTSIYSEVFMTPLYKSDGTLYVNSSRETTDTSITTGAITASKQLVTTYAEILKRRTFLEQVALDLDNEYSVAQISRMISMTPVNETEILEISVKGDDPEDVYNIAHSILNHAPDELIRVVEAGSVKLLDDATLATAPFSPNVRQNILIGILVGLILGALIVVLLEMFDTRIKAGEELVAKYGEPILGEIPTLSQN